MKKLKSKIEELIQKEMKQKKKKILLLRDAVRDELSKWIFH